MKIYRKIEFQWSDEADAYVRVAEDSFEYPDNGQVAYCKGASSEQNNLAASQTQFYNTLSADYGQQFANQSAILSSLQKSLQPTVDAGPSQFGYSPAEVNGLNSTALQTTAQGYQTAQKALQNQQATQGGGNMMLPSGVAEQNKATLAAAGANQVSSELLGIQKAGYDQGNSNYNTAISSLGGVASQYNPTGYAGAATTSGNSAANTDEEIQKANAAASPWGAIGGILGGTLGSFLNPVATTIGKNFTGTGAAATLGGNQSPYGANSD